MPKTSVIVCDDHPLFRKGVVSTLAMDPDVDVVAEANDGETCIAKIKLFKPDVLFIDLSMPVLNGFEILQWVRANGHNVRVYILSMYTELSYVERAMELGASGFLAKQDAQSDLHAALHSSSSQFYTSESIGRRNADNLPATNDLEFADRLRRVSEAERRVLELLCESRTSREIAEALHISVRTVQAHRASLCDKLDAKGPNRLLALAVQHRGLITGGARPRPAK